jgi:hypothetical protein
MSPDLVLGPLLRYAGASDATIWVETNAPCEVEVLIGCSSHRSRSFEVEGHHYALVRITGLEPDSTYEYSVALNDEWAWPEEDDPFPPPVIRTIGTNDRLTLAFGSCRVSGSQEGPYTLEKSEDRRGHGRDALHALALRMQLQPKEEWPDALLLLGDQIYADEVSPGTLDFIRSRRDTSEPPGEEVADFEEYTRLYWDAWTEPTIRWLLSTVPSAMIFDDHDVNDDWNISRTWLEKMRTQGWWEERIVGAFMSYWIYQHLGNLSPHELEEGELFASVQEAQDATRLLREFAYKADRETGSSRWSYHRDFGRVRLIVMDTRAGRVLEVERRSMLDDDEWSWIEEKASGDFDHLVFGTSLPFILGPGLHHLEAASEAICQGVWGRPAARLGEFIRQLVDLEHWSAFHDSFERLANLLRSVASGERSDDEPPASVVVLSGDVHHGYLAQLDFAGGAEVKSPVYQAVGSPLRNPLGLPERLAMRFGWSRLGERVGKALARYAGVEGSDLRWHLTHEKPWFDNHVSILELRGREAVLKVEKPIGENTGEPGLRPILERRLARDAAPDVTE